MQDYKPLGSTATTTVKQATLDHEDNINAIRSSNSGSAFPTENLVVGMVCYRSDLKEMYQYNGTSWDKVPYTKEIAESVSTKSLTVSGETSVPTPSVDNNSQTIANTQFVHGAINKLVNGAPAALDTLQELSSALGDDPNFSTTVLNKIAEKESKTDADIEHQSIRAEMATLAKKSDLPTKVSQLSNDSGYLTGNRANDIYIAKAGGTATGKVIFNAGALTEMPEVVKTTDDYLACVRFRSKSKFLGAIGKRLSNGEDIVNLRSDNNTTDTVLDSRNYVNYVPSKTGTGASGTWGISISGNATHDAKGNVIDTTYTQLTRDGLNALLDKAESGTVTPNANDWYLSKYAENGVERVVKRPVSALATYVRSTIPTATTAANGYMSKADKTKLDRIADGATNVVVDTTFSGTSDNPVSAKALSTVFSVYSKDLRTYTDDSINDVVETVSNIDDTLAEVPNTYATIDALSEAKKELQEGSNILVDADGDYVMKR